MAARNYAEAISRVLKHEGGYVNHPADPGGETNFGITIAVARANGYLGPMSELPLNTAKAIYKRRYWDAVSGDVLPGGVDYCVFDYAVNSGVGRARKVLQAAVGASTWVQAIEEAKRRDPLALVNAICDERMRFLKSLRTFGTFGRGWTSRVSGVRAAASRMAEGKSAIGVPAPTSTGKAEAKPSKGAQTGAGSAPVVVGGAAAERAAASGRPSLALAIIAVAIVAAVAAVIVIRRRAKRQQETPLIDVPVPPQGASA